MNNQFGNEVPQIPTPGINRVGDSSALLPGLAAIGIAITSIAAITEADAKTLQQFGLEVMARADVKPKIDAMKDTAGNREEALGIMEISAENRKLTTKEGTTKDVTHAAIALKREGSAVYVTIKYYSCPPGVKPTKDTPVVHTSNYESHFVAPGGKAPAAKKK